MNTHESVRAMWAAGDYARWGDQFADVGAQLAREVGVDGLDVLDVATGTGNAALAAARGGGRVTGLDITPELLAIARHRSSAAGPDAAMSRLGTIIAAFFPPPAEAPPSPTDWGDPALVTDFFAGLPATVTTARRTVPIRWASADDAAAMIATTCSPMIGAVAALRETGDWARARAAIIDMLQAEATPEPGALEVEMPYLLTMAQRRPARPAAVHDRGNLWAICAKNLPRSWEGRFHRPPDQTRPPDCRSSSSGAW